MTVGVLLLLYSLAVTVLAPAVLRRLSRGGTAPRLAIAAWSAAMGGVLLAWILTAILVGRALLSDRAIDTLLEDCITTMGLMAAGGHGPTLQVALLLLAGLSILAVGVLVGRVVVALARARIHTYRHCRNARLVADVVPGPEGSVVLDTPERVVYCVAGRPPTIVVTRGALDALDDAQLAAVLTHERAHLSGRHHLLIAASRAIATVLPRLRLFPEGAAEIGRLVEMRADDVAARRHPGAVLVGALLALSGFDPLPARALGASGVGVADRVERLLNPQHPVRTAPVRLALLTALTLLLVGPVAAAGLATIAPHLCPFPLL